MRVLGEQATWQKTDAHRAAPTAPQGAEAESPTFFERRAAKDPSVDHSSHSTMWVDGCGECPGEAAPQSTDERNGGGDTDA